MSHSNHAGQGDFFGSSGYVLGCTLALFFELGKLGVQESGGRLGEGGYTCQNALFCWVVFCQRLVWLVNISSSPQRTCPSEEKPQTCYCSDLMSMKHLLIERKKEEVCVWERGKESESTAWAERWGRSKAREEQPEQNVITDNYGQERRRETKSSNILIHALGGRRKYSFSIALAGSWLNWGGGSS